MRSGRRTLAASWSRSPSTRPCPRTTRRPGPAVRPRPAARAPPETTPDPARPAAVAPARCRRPASSSLPRPREPDALAHQGRSDPAAPRRGVHTEHPDVALLRRQPFGFLVVLALVDAPVELERDGPQDPAVLDRDKDGGSLRAIGDRGDVLQVAGPVVAPGELPVRVRRHPARFLVLAGPDRADLRGHSSLLMAVAISVVDARPPRSRVTCARSARTRCTARSTATLVPTSPRCR